MRRRFTPIFVFLCLAFTAVGTNRDSLDRAIQSARPDTNKVRLLYDLATHPDSKDSSVGMGYASQMLALARQLKYVKGVARAWQAMGVIQFYSVNFRRSIYFFDKASLAFKESEYPRGNMFCYHWMARCYRRIAEYTQYGKYLNLLHDQAALLKDDEYLSYALEGYGNLYRYLGDYSRSIENYTRAIELSEKRGDLHDVSVALNNLSLVYGIIGEADEELKIEKRTLSVISRLKDSASMVLCLGNLSSIYEGMKKPDTAQYYCDLAMSIIKRRGEENLNFKDVASVYGQHANLLSEKKDYLQAVEFYNKSVSLSKDNGDIKSVASGYANLAGVFALMNNKTMAEEYFLKALEINKTIGFINGQMMNYQALEDLYKFVKNEKKATESHDQYVLLKDSLDAMTNARKLTEAEALYKINEHREELARLNEAQLRKQREQERMQYLIYGSGGGIVVALSIVLVIWFRRKKLEAAQAEFEEGLGI